jgi:hypothetical protein
MYFSTPLINRKLHLITLFVVAASTMSCHNADKNTNTITTEKKQADQPVINCDTFALDKPPIKDDKKALAVLLETSSLDWFLEKRQSMWREAIAWASPYEKKIPVDSNTLIECIGLNRNDVFIYIPHQFYLKEKKGNEYFRFFIVNNTDDTLAIPRIDAVIDSIRSSVSALTTPDNWISYQETSRLVECGNSFWTMKLAPHTAMESRLDSYYMNMGDTTFNYRIEMLLPGRKIVSNPIQINLMRKQVPYLGKSFTH